MNSLGEGHWAVLIIGMVNSHMAEYTDIPPIPFSLNKAIDSRDCKPLRKQNSIFIDAKPNAASKGTLHLSVESWPEVREAIERTLKHHEPDAPHHFAYKNMAKVTKTKKLAPRKTAKASGTMSLKLTGLSDELKKSLGLIGAEGDELVIEDPTTL